MLGPRHQVRDTVLCQHPGKAAGAAPAGVLATAIGEHFLGRLIFRHGPPVGLNDRFGGRAAVQTEASHVARVVVQERHDVGVPAAKPEGEEVALPHLIRGGPLEESRPRQVARAFFAGRLQPRLLQVPAHRRGAYAHQEPPLQDFGNAPDPVVSVGLLHLHDLLGHCGREAAPRPGRRLPA